MKKEWKLLTLNELNEIKIKIMSSYKQISEINYNRWLVNIKS